MPTAVKTRGSVSSFTQFLTTSKESSPAEAEKQSTTATTSQGSCASINKGHFQAFILSDLKAEILCTLHSIRCKHFRVPCKKVLGFVSYGPGNSWKSTRVYSAMPRIWNGQPYYWQAVTKTIKITYYLIGGWQILYQLTWQIFVTTVLNKAQKCFWKD